LRAASVTLIKLSFTKSDYQISCRVSKKCGHGEADYLVFVDGVVVESSKTRARRYDADELPLGSERGLSGNEDRQRSDCATWLDKARKLPKERLLCTLPCHGSACLVRLWFPFQILLQTTQKEYLARTDQ
ncbi:MAG: hypothetical protein WBP69_21250, partial [Terriglobales bacterium]